MRDAGIEVTVGVLEAECMAINRRFMTFNEQHRPYILLKWAQTANGYIAQADRRSLHISTPLTQMLSHKLRSENDAILVGRGTLESDRPQLNVRQWTGSSPERIVLSHHADNIPEGFTWCESIDAVISHLCEEQRQSLIVEGGAHTLAAFLERGLWDELRVETAPFTVCGGIAAPDIPDDAVYLRTEQYDDNIIRWFGKKRH